MSDLDRPAGPLTLTYGDVVGRAAALAGGLAGAGPGHRVALLLQNSAEFVIAFVGVVAAGAVVVPLNTRLREDELRHMLQDSGAGLLVTEDRFLTRFPGLGATPGLRIHSVDGGGLAGLESAPVDGPLAPAPSGLMSLIYTSGTTGEPKAVMLAHRAWSAVADQATSVLGIGAADAVLHVAPSPTVRGSSCCPPSAPGRTTSSAARTTRRGPCG